MYSTYYMPSTVLKIVHVPSLLIEKMTLWGMCFFVPVSQASELRHRENRGLDWAWRANSSRSSSDSHISSQPPLSAAAVDMANSTPLTIFMAVGKLFCFSDLWIPHLWNGVNNHLSRVSWGLYVKSLTPCMTYKTGNQWPLQWYSLNTEYPITLLYR